MDGLSRPRYGDCNLAISGGRDGQIGGVYFVSHAITFHLGFQLETIMKQTKETPEMPNPTRRPDPIAAIPLVAACAFLALAGCASDGAPPVTTSQAAGLALRGLPAPERNARAPKKIYVVNAGNNTLTTYKYNRNADDPNHHRLDRRSLGRSRRPQREDLRR